MMVVKKINYFLFYILSVSIIILSCNNTVNPPEEDTIKLSDKESWTIMVYLDGDNDLETYAIADLNEMEGIDFSNSKINVIVLLDRIPGYDASNSNWTDTRLFEVKYDSAGINSTIVSTRLASTELGLTLLSDTELNMGDKTTMSNFIDFSKTNYTADNYMLIIWNHGDGWRSFTGNNDAGLFKGICTDVTSTNDKLYMKEVGEAVTGKGLNIIGFDACNMGMLEVAYELKSHADYMIASEAIIPGDGWEYNYIFNSLIKTTQSVSDLYNAVINAYYLRYKYTSGTSLSVVDLTKIDDVYTKLNSFSLKLYQEITSATIRDNVKNAILDNVENYWISNGSDFNIDLWHLANIIQSNFDYCDTEASDLKNAIDAAVINEWNSLDGHPNSNGIAIHFIVGTDPSIDDYGMDNFYCKGYSTEPIVAFVQDVNNNWVANYSGSITGPGLLYRLWFESL